MPAAATIDQRWIPPADEARTLDGRMAASRSRQELPTRLTTLMSGAVPFARKSLQAELFVLGFNLQSLFFNFFGYSYGFGCLLLVFAVAVTDLGFVIGICS